MSKLPITVFVVIVQLSLATTVLGVRCLACSGVVQPKYCSSARYCPNMDSCSIRQYRTINGETLYDLDCSQHCPVKRQSPQRYFLRILSNTTLPTASATTSTRTTSRSTTTIVRRAATTTPPVGPQELCNVCCNGDMCNTNGCSSAGYPPMVTRGPVCFGCSQTSDPTRCDKLTFCNRNEKCAVVEEHIFGERVFSTRCVHPFTCPHDQPTPIGKRRISKRQKTEFLCAPCCDSDFCNTECKGVPITTAASALSTLHPPVSVQTPFGYQDKEFLVMFPDRQELQYAYIYMSTRVPGSVVIEAPHFFSTKTVVLQAGKNVYMLNRTIFGHDNSLENKGIYLKASVPMSVSGLVHSKGRTEGFAVLPLEKLGNRYKVISESTSTLFMIAAIHSNTTLKLQFNISDGQSLLLDGKSYHSGSIYTRIMDRLETLQIYSGYDMTGTEIFSNYPVAVSSGDFYVDGIQPLVEYLPPISEWGTKFIIPPFRPATDYYLRILLGDSLDGIVTLVNSKGRETYSILHSKYIGVDLDSVPTYVESTKPILLTVFAKNITTHAHNMSDTMVWIPPLSMFRNRYTIANLNPTNSSGHFAEKAVIVLPSGEVSGLRVDGIRIDYNDVHSSISDGNTLYSILTVPMDGINHILTHTDPGITFGTFVYGVDEGGSEFPAFCFPAGV